MLSIHKLVYVYVYVSYFCIKRGDPQIRIQAKQHMVYKRETKQSGCARIQTPRTTYANMVLHNRLSEDLRILVMYGGTLEVTVCDWGLLWFGIIEWFYLQRHDVTDYIHSRILMSWIVWFENILEKLRLLREWEQDRFDWFWQMWKYSVRKILWKNGKNFKNSNSLEKRIRNGIYSLEMHWSSFPPCLRISAIFALRGSLDPVQLCKSEISEI